MNTNRASTIRFVASSFALCLGALGILAPSQAAGQSKTFPVRFDAKVGDKATILIRHGKLVPGSGEATPGVTAVATYRMEVTGKSRDGYRILWTPQSLEFEGIPRADAAQL